MRGSVLAACAALAGCAWGGLRPGPTKAGLAFETGASTAREAREQALDRAVGLFAAPRTSLESDARALARARSGELLGRERLKDGKGVVEVKVDALAALLARRVRPAGYGSGADRVAILLAEPDPSDDRATDALRRALLARGLDALDGREALGRKDGGATSAELVAAALKAGADWVVVGRAGVESSPEPASQGGRARAVVEAALYAAGGAGDGAPVRADASTLDASTAAAAAKALELAGEQAAEPAAAAIKELSGGRAETALLAAGDLNPATLRSLIDAVRAIDGVEGAALRTLRGPDGAAVVRVFLRGLGTDDLAARLLRARPSLLLLSVEPGDRRLAVDLGGGQP